LSQAQGDPTTLLVALADDGDTDVRAAAAWALSATGDSGASGPQLLSLVGNETDPGVRARLYQALENQDGLDSNTLLAAVRNEQDPTARIAALDLLAHALRENPTPELENFFEQTAIPQLRQIALSGGDSQTRMSAVIALARGNNLSAQTALREIGQTSADPKIRNAADSAIGILAKK
ncbi:MAG TPA: HEAT repeat domain-containing protein, partial [Verrucomicrobiae bacterium]|nr:HEAT repeat domain-containing protein [Verrucomicrobiae bacterium]